MSTNIIITNTVNPNSNDNTYGHGYTTFDISANFFPLTGVLDSSTNVVEYGFVWGDNDASNNMVNWDSSYNFGAINPMPDPHDASYSVSNLALATPYFTRAYIKDASSTTYHFSTDDASFTTHTQSTVIIDNIDETGEIGQGYSTARWNTTMTNPQFDISGHGFVWGTNPTPTFTDLSNNFGVNNSDNPIDASKSIINLAAETKYYVRAWLQYQDTSNSVVTVYTDTAKTFTTHTPPEIDILSITDISGNNESGGLPGMGYISATWNGDISNNYQGDISGCGFVWKAGDGNPTISASWGGPGNNLIINLGDASGLHNFGPQLTDGIDISYNTADLSDNGLTWSTLQKFTVRGWTVFQDTSSTIHTVYSDISENFITHILPEIDILSITDISGNNESGGPWMGMGYTTATWNADISNNYQEDLSACGFVWKQGSGNPTIDASMNSGILNINLLDASEFVNLGTGLSGSTGDISFNTQNLSDNNTVYTVRGYVVYQDTSNSVVTVYTDTAKTFTTHTPPEIDILSITDISGNNESGGPWIGMGYTTATWNADISNNYQQDLSACGFVWKQGSGNPTIDASMNSGILNINLLDASEFVNLGTGLSGSTGDISFNTQNLSDNDTEYTVRGYVVYQDTSNSVVTVYTAGTAKTFTTHTPPDPSIDVITDISGNDESGGPWIGMGYSTATWNTGSITNSQLDISGHGFVWGTNNPPTFTDSSNNFGVNTSSTPFTKTFPVENLTYPNDTYFVRSWLQYQETSSNIPTTVFSSGVKTFTTYFPPKIDIEGTITDISGMNEVGGLPGMGYISATWNGDISNNYQGDISGCGFVWKAGDGNPTISASWGGPGNNLIINLGDASGLHNFGPQLTDGIDISYNTADLSDNGLTWSTPQKFTVRGWTVFQDTSSTIHTVYSDISENFITHITPEIDILSITDISGMDEVGGLPGMGYTTATWNADISTNYQQDLSACGFVWKQGSGNPTIDASMNSGILNINLLDASEFVNLGTDLSGSTGDISFNTQNLSDNDTEYTVRGYVVYQDTSNSVVTVYTAGTAKTFKTHIPPVPTTENIGNTTGTGQGYSTAQLELSRNNPQADISGIGFVWGLSDKGETFVGWDSSYNSGKDNNSFAGAGHTLDINGLNFPGQTYYTRSWLQYQDTSSNTTTLFGGEKNYTTHFIPEIDMLPITDISGNNESGGPWIGMGYTTATWNADISNNYNSDISACGFVWKQGPGNPTVDASMTSGVININPLDASDFINLGSNSTTDDISFNVQNLSDNDIQYTVRAYWIYQETLNNMHLLYSDLSKNFNTHKPPIIDISNTITNNTVPDGYVTARWWGDISQNIQEDLSSCGFVWKEWDTPTGPSSPPTIADESANILSTLTQNTDIDFSYYTALGSSGLLQRDTSYNIRAFYQYQDTSSTTITLYSDASLNFKTHTQPTSSCVAPDNIGDAFATLHGSILTNPQQDISNYGFCWSQAKTEPKITDSSFNNFGPSGETNFAYELDISGLRYSLSATAVDGPSSEIYYVRSYTQYDSSGSSLITDYSGIDISFNTLDISGVEFNLDPSSIVIDPSYTIADFTIDISDNPPYPENTGAITNWGIVWETSGNYYDKGEILNISVYDGSHNFGSFSVSGEYVDGSMVSFWGWENRVLDPSSDYFVRAFAFNPSSTDPYYSLIYPFTTKFLPHPTLNVSGATDISLESAVLNGSVAINPGDASGTRNWGWILSDISNIGFLLSSEENYIANGLKLNMKYHDLSFNFTDDISGSAQDWGVGGYPLTKFTDSILEEGRKYFYTPFARNPQPAYDPVFEVDDPSGVFVYSSLPSFFYTQTESPSVSLVGITNVTTTTATITGTLVSNGTSPLLAIGFVWSNNNTNPEYDTGNLFDGSGQTNILTSPPQEAPPVMNISVVIGLDYPLEPGKEYFFNIFARNIIPTISYGSVQSFKTTGITPVCQTTMVDEIGYTSVHFYGQIIDNPAGLSSLYITEYGFIWDTSSNYHNNNNQILDLDTYDGSYVIQNSTGSALSFTDSSGAFDIYLYGNLHSDDVKQTSGSYAYFDPSSDYVMCAFAKNQQGEDYGDILSFTTKELTLPVIDASDASNIRASYATFIVDISQNFGDWDGTVFANALDASASGQILFNPIQDISKCGFCWSSNTFPTILDNSNNSGEYSGTSVFDLSFSGITDLSTNTTYYVRAYATTSEGETYYGNQISFVSSFDSSGGLIYDYGFVWDTSENVYKYIPFGGLINYPAMHAFSWPGYGHINIETPLPFIDISGTAMCDLFPGTLNPSETYIFRAFARNGVIDISGNPPTDGSGNVSDASGYVYSEIKMFTTTAALDISSSGVTNMTSTQVTLNGLVELNPNGINQYGFVWDLSANYPGYDLSQNLPNEKWTFWPDISDNSYNFVPVDMAANDPSLNADPWSFLKQFTGTFIKEVSYYYRAFGLSKDALGGLNLDGYIYGDPIFFQPPPTCGWPTYNISPAIANAEGAKPISSFTYQRMDDHFIDGVRSGYDIQLYWTDPLSSIQGILLQRNDVNMQFFRNAPTPSSSETWGPSGELSPILQNLQFEIEYIFTIKTYTHNSKCLLPTYSTSSTTVVDQSFSTETNLSVKNIDMVLRIQQDRCAEVPIDALQIQIDPNYNAIPKNIEFAFLAKNPTGKNSTRNIICKDWAPP